MSSDVALRVNNVSKRYEIYEAPHHRLFQTLLHGRKKFYKEFWALRDVSFEVRCGECIGVIGRNGSGKSTLLQIIAGTLAPATGEVEVAGRISALLELGSGFNIEFTGHENIYMNGAILGLSKAQIDKKFDEIAEFADIGEFIEQPVKIYSSGMYVRLAFAIAVSVDPNILIIDESLAVGDMSFQKKCMERIDHFREVGKTIIFCSHDMHVVGALCNHAIWLKDGAVAEIGKSEAVISSYVSWMTESKSKDESSCRTVNKNPNFYVRNSEIIEILKVKVLDEHENSKEVFFEGEKIKIEIEFLAKENLVNPHFNLAIFRSDKVLVCLGSTSFDRSFKRKSYEKGVCRVSVTIPIIQLNRGDYTVGFSVWDSAKRIVFANNITAEFKVRTLKVVFGPLSEKAVYFPAVEWNL